MNMKPLKAAAGSGAARPRKGIADQPDPLPGPGAARGGAVRSNAGRAVRGSVVRCAGGALAGAKAGWESGAAEDALPPATGAAQSRGDAGQDEHGS